MELPSRSAPRRSAPATFGAAQAPPRIFAGTSGWAYPTWKPGFYPEGLPQKNFLPYFASQLTSVEVNYTFRSLPTASMLQGWLSATPPNFRFSFKAPQRITHFSRLRDCEALVAQFLGSLEPARNSGRLGLLLFQLPPNFKADPALLDSFLHLAAFAGPVPPKLAFEFRHESWFADQTYSVLRAHDAALCIAESDDLTTPEVHTASTHTCFRLRRNGGYTPAEIAAFADRFLALSRDRDTYLYFKHEDDPTGALNAQALIHALNAAAGAI